jgi:hypothetical protein
LPGLICVIINPHQHDPGPRTPVVAAIIVGLVGYVGTLISSYQNRQLKREKQEGTLILEVIKTTGTVEEKERQTAANLVFLADAGLITSIKSSELEKLRVKAQGAVPSLPAPQGVEFKKSLALTSALQLKLQSALRDYQAWLVGIGYDPGQAQGPAIVRVDEEIRDNAYFDNENVVLGVNLAGDPEYLLSCPERGNVLPTRAISPSVGRKTSAPRPCLTPLNTQPTHCPINASRAASRLHAHDSGSVWLAAPSP